jgi:hypothetical protein
MASATCASIASMSARIWATNASRSSFGIGCIMSLGNELGKTSPILTEIRTMRQKNLPDPYEDSASRLTAWWCNIQRMIPSKLRTAAARYVLNIDTIEDLVDAAHAGLDRGLHSYSLGELASQYTPTDLDSRRWFVAAMQELGIALPSREESVRILVDETTHAIVEEIWQPYQAIQSLYRIIRYRQYDTRDETAQLIANDDDLRQWFHLTDDIDYYVNHDDDEQRIELPARGVDHRIDKQLDDCIKLAHSHLRTRYLPQLQPVWRTPAVVGLVTAIREDRAFDRLPILADALQEAGCEHEEILGHLREQEPHIRCCWVAELLAELPSH